MKPGVFITVDVECSMGGAWGDPALRPVPPVRAVMGRYNGNAFGLPLICDILRASGLAATFFVEPFVDEQGHPGEMEAPCRLLVEQGQDVQLHVHPNHWHYGLRQGDSPFAFTDCFAECTREERRTLVREGADRLRRWTGRRPVAFRAGNFGASEASLRDVASVGVRIDSSYAFPFAGSSCRFVEPDPYNGSRWYGDVLELAVSGCTQPRIPGLHRAKPLDLVAVGFDEMRAALERIVDSGVDACVILHSFSLMKVRNVQYDGGRPNRVVIRRFRKLCRWLAARRATVPVYTFSDLARALGQGGYAARSSPPPRLSLGRALLRKAVQAYNRPYWT